MCLCPILMVSERSLNASRCKCYEPFVTFRLEKHTRRPDCIFDWILSDNRSNFISLWWLTLNCVITPQFAKKEGGEGVTDWQQSIDPRVQKAHRNGFGVCVTVCTSCRRKGFSFLSSSDRSSPSSQSFIPVCSTQACRVVIAAALTLDCRDTEDMSTITRQDQETQRFGFIGLLSSRINLKVDIFHVCILYQYAPAVLYTPHCWL